MRHKLEVLLLLMDAHHLELLAKHRLELLLERKRERKPRHIAGLSTLPEINDTLDFVFARRSRSELVLCTTVRWVDGVAVFVDLFFVVFVIRRNAVSRYLKKNNINYEQLSITFQNLTCTKTHSKHPYGICPVPRLAAAHTSCPPTQTPPLRPDPNSNPPPFASTWPT